MKPWICRSVSLICFTGVTRVARSALAASGRAAEQRDELASFQLIEEHSVPCQPGPDCRISN
jgi:hypothetical protein